MEPASLMTDKMSGPEPPAGSMQAGREAVRSLFVQHQKRVYSVALNFFGGNGALAQDITQQVFLKLLTRPDDFRGDCEFTTWIYRITVNACVDETRKLRRFLNFGDLFGDRQAGPKLGSEERIQRAELASEVQRALKALDPKFRLPLVLKYVEDLTYQEIAEILECSIGTVSSRIHRGHKLLAGKLAHLKDKV